MAISLKELSERIAASIPVGTIVAYYGTTAPSGWLICDGRSCAGTALANLIGKTTTPDLRGRFIRMVGGNAAGIGVAQEDEFKSHNHKTMNTGSDWYSVYGANYLYTLGNTASYKDAVVNTAIKHSGGVETRPVNMAFNYIIRAISYYDIAVLSHLNTKFGGERR